MKVLLDTHAFLWYSLEDRLLPATLCDLIHARENDVLLSIVSIWEIAVKLQAGKLELLIPLEHLVEQSVSNGIGILPVKSEHVYQTLKLELHHRDPFDRMIIAQGIVEDCIIASKDEAFRHYDVKVLWDLK